LSVVISQVALPFSQLARPGGGSWTWADITNLKVRFFFTKGTNAWDGKTMTIYEVWADVYPLPTPPTSSTTFSVQPGVAYGVGASSGVPAIFIELYANNVVDLFSYETTVTFDTNILSPIDAWTYGPWTNTLGAGIVLDDAGGLVTISFSMVPPIPIGTAFTGNAPVCRIYFVIDADGQTPLTILKGDAETILGDSTGTAITRTIYDGLYSTTAPPVPEFPLGLGIIMALAPLIPIVYIWRLRKNKPKLLTAQTNPKGLKQ
jgi:hypothetical protein